MTQYLKGKIRDLLSNISVIQYQQIRVKSALSIFFYSFTSDIAPKYDKDDVLHTKDRI